MKALLINEADEIGPNNGPDYSFGWGHVNAADAAEIINFHDYEGCDHIEEASVAAGATFSYSINSSGAQPLKITLVWTDPASLVINGGTLNPAGANYLVNDLNLRLDEGVTTFFPWVLDPADLKSQCKNTPFDAARFSGRVVRTIVGGRTGCEHV